MSKLVMFLIILQVLLIPFVYASIDIVDLNNDASFFYIGEHINVTLRTPSSYTDISIDEGSCQKTSDILFNCALIVADDTLNFVAFNNGNEVDYLNKTIPLDTYKPRIINFEVVPTIKGADIILKASDENTVTSGIKSVAIKLNNNVVKTLNFNSVLININESIDFDEQSDVSAEITDLAQNTVESNITHVNKTHVNIHDFKIMSNNQELNLISNNPQIANIQFIVDTDSIDSAILNISSLVQKSSYVEQYAHYPLNPNHCYKINESLKCFLNNIVINPANTDVDISVSVIAHNTISEQEFHKTFVLDTTSPSIAELRTNYCFNDKCFIKTGENKFYFILSDNSESMSKNLLFFKFKNSKHAVANCSNGICVASININSCNPREILQISTTGIYKSQDDAGNVFEPFSTVLYCDNALPRHINTVLNSSDSAFDFIEGGKSLSIDAYFSDSDSEHLSAIANLTNIGGNIQEVVCSKLNTSIFKCQFSVDSIINQDATKIISITAYDSVNHSVTQTNTVKIVFSKNESAKTPDCIKISSVKFKPENINRLAVQLSMDNSLDYPLYGLFTPLVSSVHNCKNTILYETTIKECYYLDSNNSKIDASNVFNSVQVNNIDAGINDNVFIDFRPNSKLNIYENNMNIYCNMSFKIVVNNNYYPQPLNKLVEFKLHFVNSALDLPGKVFVKKIKKKEKLVNNTRAIGLANAILSTASQICSAKSYLTMLQNAGAVTEFTEKVLEQLGILDGTEVSFGVKWVRFTTKLNNVVKKTKSTDPSSKDKSLKLFSDIFSKACMISHCSYGSKFEDQFKESEFWGDFFKPDSNNVAVQSGGAMTFGDLGQVLQNSLVSGINNPDLKNSLFTCIQTECWPGIVYHINKLRTISCNELYCLKQNSMYGMGITSCSEAKSLAICKYVVGNIVEFVGPIRVAKNLMNNAYSVLKNFVPRLLINLVSSATCGEHYKQLINYNKPITVHDLSISRILSCELPLAISNKIETKNLKSSSTSFMYPNDFDICKLAMCNSADPSKCNVGQASFISSALKKIGFDMVDPSTIDLNEQEKLIQDMHRKRNNYNDLLDDILTYQTYDNCDAKNETCTKNKKRLLERFRYYYGIDEVDINTSHNSKDVLNRIDNFLKKPRDSPSEFNLEGYENDKELADLYSALQTTINFKESSSSNANQDILKDIQKRESPLGKAARARLAKEQHKHDNLCEDKDLKKYLECKDDKIVNIVFNNKKIPLTDFMKKYRNNYTNFQNYMKFLNKRKSVKNIINLALSFLWDKYLANFVDMASTDSLIKGSGKILEYLNSDTWMNKICSPNVVLTHKDEDTLAFSCSGSDCLPVLTFAMERGPYNWTDDERTTVDRYIYTFTYVVGPVEKKNKFNIYFVDDHSKKHYLFVGKESHKPKFVELTNSEKNSLSFVSKNKYEKVCFKFKSGYPGDTDDSIYCRKVLLSAFDTGNPSHYFEQSASTNGVADEEIVLNYD